MHMHWVLTKQLQSVTLTPLTMTFRETLSSALAAAAFAVVRLQTAFCVFVLRFEFQMSMDFQSRNSCIAATQTHAQTQRRKKNSH